MTLVQDFSIQGYQGTIKTNIPDSLGHFREITELATGGSWQEQASQVEQELLEDEAEKQCVRSEIWEPLFFSLIQ